MNRLSILIACFAFCLVLSARPVAAQQSEIKVFALVNANAVDMLSVLQHLIDGRIAVDQRTNSVIVQGTPETLKIAEALITRLDSPAVQAEQFLSRVFPVPKEKFATIVAQLGVVEGTIMSDARSNTITVTGKRSTLEQV